MALRESTSVPVCTYRVQLNGQFTFEDLGRLVPYFTSLGISDLYLSPIFTATPGSTHGYDVTDYGAINPELGGRDGFDRLAAQLRRAGCGVLLDFVPNHMGIAGLLNRWWRDVLESGRFSPYAPFFDIHWRWETDRSRPRILVPVLEDHYGRVLTEGKIALGFTDEFSFGYGDVTLPLNPGSYTRILEPLAESAKAGESIPEIRAVVAGFAALPRVAAALDPNVAEARSDRVSELKKDLAAALAARPELQERLAARLKQINGTPGNPASFDELHELIEQQHYRLARWKTGAHEINYRRFFAIASLVGLHMEKPEVFRECHALLGQLLRDGKITGLRIDHIDGLRQPEDYLQRLQSLERPDPARPLYVLVEKILAGAESLPERWAVHGTTGYEFIAQLAGVFIAGGTAGRFDELHRRFTGETLPYADTVRGKKRLVIAEMFANAVSSLGAELVEILTTDRRWRDLSRHELTTVVSELMANFPVYRTYRKSPQPASGQDRKAIEEACRQALASNPRADPEPFEFVRDLLLGIYPDAGAPEERRTSLLNWVLTFQQYTGAVMAKAVEDTAYYTYNRLIALNEVGGDPGVTHGSVEEFHRANGARLAVCPHSMVTTSTHDTKFSEDVRARLYVLSELPDEWENWFITWRRLTAPYVRHVGDSDAPDAVDLYRFFQVILGVWPLGLEAADSALRARLREHFRKSVHEAKRHTSMLQSNEDYLQACDRFVDEVSTAPEFLASFLPRARRLARLGLVNSLAQTVLKCTVPGVPDIYWGNEVWNFSLVDPDNRRQVDFAACQLLRERTAALPAARLLEQWRDGAIKLRVIESLLQFRAAHRELFAAGDYQPVEGRGEYARHLVAFRRTLGDAALLVVVPRLSADLGAPPLGLVWEDTRLDLAAVAPRLWRDLLTGRAHDSQNPLELRSLFADLPFAVLEGR